MINAIKDNPSRLRHVLSRKQQMIDQLRAEKVELIEALEIAVEIINRYTNNNKRIAGYSNIIDALAKARGEVA